jgi:hypothetical protein
MGCNLLIFNDHQNAWIGQSPFFDRLAMFIENPEAEKALIYKPFLLKIGVISGVFESAR